jgi:hypothetical protein
MAMMMLVLISIICLALYVIGKVPECIYLIGKIIVNLIKWAVYLVIQAYTVIICLVCNRISSHKAAAVKEELRQVAEDENIKKYEEKKEDILRAAREVNEAGIAATNTLRGKYRYADASLFEQYATLYAASTLPELRDMEANIKASHDANMCRKNFMEPSRRRYTLSDLSDKTPIENTSEYPLTCTLYEIGNQYVMVAHNVEADTTRIFQSFDISKIEVRRQAMIQAMKEASKKNKLVAEIID